MMLMGHELRPRGMRLRSQAKQHPFQVEGHRAKALHRKTLWAEPAVRASWRQLLPPLKLQPLPKLIRSFRPQFPSPRRHRCRQEKVRKAANTLM